MQANSVNQQREIRKDDLLRIAPFSKRQLTEVYRAGLLPWPLRRSYPGSKKPVYYWDESIIDQATLLYGLLHWSRIDHRVRLPLWCRLAHNLAKKGRYVSNEENGEVMSQYEGGKLISHFLAS